MLRVHFTAGDGKGWAIDEDLRQIRIALRGHIRESLAASADVIYCPFWGNLSHYPNRLLEERFVICHADNPPIFYITQGYFAEVQPLVDLWVARSQEAYQQFQALNLPVEYVPYTTDPGKFFPLEKEAAKGLREKYGLDDADYLIANFHRDTEGSDLNRPKAQKSPEMMVEIARHLKRREQSIRFLLAGPRRHWLRRECQRHGIPYAFIGDEKILGDDFGENILTREVLNELYAITDLYIVPSRWEGGPQSIMEAAACHCPILSTHVGLAMDMLDPACLFQTAEVAAEIITKDIATRHLKGFVTKHAETFQINHTTEVMVQKLPGLLHSREALIHKRKKKRAVFTLANEMLYEVLRRLPKAKASHAVCLLHEKSDCPEFEAYVERVRSALKKEDISVHEVAERAPHDLILLGHWAQAEPKGVQLMGGTWMGASNHFPGIVSSMAEAVRLRKRGVSVPLVALPFRAINAAEEPSFDWLVIAADDDSASEKIWDALSRRVPILYPTSQPYRGQVYHGGLAYGSARDLREKKDMAYESLQDLGWIPAVRDCVRELMRVLESR